MRFTEFKQPISESNDTAEVSSDLNQIQQLVSNDPVKEKHATSYLTKILKKIIYRTIIFYKICWDHNKLIKKILIKIL
jgi:hypothetical protein